MMDLTHNGSAMVGKLSKADLTKPQDEQSECLQEGKDRVRRLKHDVFLIVKDNMAHILNLRDCQFYGINAIGAQMLLSLTERDAPDTIVFKKTFLELPILSI